MKALFGVVSLLIAVAIVGMLTVKQLKSVGNVSVRSAEPGSTAQTAPAGATVREQSQRLQDKVRSDVVKALEQGAAVRDDESQK